MAVLAALKKDRLGEWPTVDDFLSDLRKRETNSVAALALALGATTQDRRELAEGAGLAVLVEVASDLRIPKTSRVAAARCAMEAGASGETVGALFIGAGDLADDPRLADCAKELVEKGLPAALRVGATHGVSLQAASFARAAHAAAGVAGQARIEELLAAAPPEHAGKIASIFALGSAPLPTAHQEKWAKLLGELCAAHRRAPAAARRLGLVAPWPPNVPAAFAAVVREAEEASAHVASQGAATGEVKRVSATPEPAGAPSRPVAPPDQTHAAGPPPAGHVALPRAPSRATLTEMGKKMAPPIRPSLFRRPTGVVTEGPGQFPPKPMPPVAPQSSSAAARVTENAMRRKDPVPAPKEEPAPPAVRKARAADGPFAARLAALFADRPEAVERLCAAAEARSALVGQAAALEELERELSRDRWKERRPPREQLDRLAAAARGEHAAWSAAARLLLAHL
jgi:hypothetical protein